jgi:DNA-binding NarL/FixJ family response regulator
MASSDVTPAHSDPPDETSEPLRVVVAEDDARLREGIASLLIEAKGRRDSLLDELTERERNALSLIAEGRSNRAIANRLYLSPRAIERHVQATFHKLRLPDSEDDNRRVLAVLALLGQ